MIFRLLLYVLAFLGFVWLWKQLAGASRRRPDRRPGATRAAGGRMVRDRVCDTFLPESRALQLEAGGETHYFCSEGCRQRFLGQAAETGHQT